MKAKVLSVLVGLAIPFTAYSSAGGDRLSEHTLASEIANCYVAHQRFGTEFYQSGSAEIYKEVIDSLIGEGKRNRVINSASTRQGGPQGIIKNRNAKFEAQKYCTNIDEKLARLQ